MGLTLLGILLSNPAPGAVFQVVNTSNTGTGSFRQALLDANDNPGLDTITFSIGSGGRTISPSASLPAITDPVIIDGTTQPGYVDKPLIELNGANAGATAGIRLFAGSSTIRGLVINRCGGDGIYIEGSGTNVIQGNYIGVDATGAIKRPNAQEGIFVSGSWNNVIGGTGASERNLISGNRDAGVYFLNGGNNLLLGNYIGTTLAGTAGLGNGNNGISIYNSRSNVVGAPLTAARNVVAGNVGSGIYLFGSFSVGNSIEGNYIGLNALGSGMLSNSADGITISGAPANTIGGTAIGAGNVISGNGMAGVFLSGAGAGQNLVLGNKVGCDASGLTAIGNNLAGVVFSSAHGNTLGGVEPGAGNLISGNHQDGVYLLANSSANLLQGNWIGTDVSGITALPNGINGISISAAHANVVGGMTILARNIVSGNTHYGVHVLNGAATNSILGNYIGTDTNGTRALPNQRSGVRVDSALNTVGSSTPDGGNLISGNSEDGVVLVGSTASNNVVSGNVLGTTATGAAPLPNGRSGVGISGAAGNLIQQNLISGNMNAGIYLLTSTAKGNRIQGNQIGTDLMGNLMISNYVEGIFLDGAASNTIGGPLPEMRNLISANRTRGIFLTGASGNVIQGNWIGVRADGTSALGNRYHGVECEAGCYGNVIGGSAPGEGNRIAFSQTVYTGVRIRAGAAGNRILGNEIFSNGALGIDLGAAGVLANDNCDLDTGANQHQNYPVLTKVMSGAGTLVRGTFSFAADGAYLVQFFSSPVSDPTGYGEGAAFLGEKTLVTGRDCTGAFEVLFSASVPAGYHVAATATDAEGNTSEFSKSLPVDAIPKLEISVSQTGLTLSWPAGTPELVLKSALSLAHPLSWVTVTTVPILENGRYSVTLPLEEADRFFTLAFQQVESVPVLEIAVSPSGVTLSWPQTEAPLVLKSADSLEPPLEWVTVTNVPVLENGRLSVSLPVEGTNRFFTLVSE